jgi:hypothetical protein
MKIELCPITCAKAGGQVGRQVHNPVMNRDFKYSNQFLLETNCVLQIWE